MYKELYPKIIDALVEDGYIIIENALHVELAAKLKKFAENESDFKRAGISAKSDLHVDDKRRTDKIHWLDEDDDVQSEFLSFTNGLQEQLNRELYLGLSYNESHFAIYEKGDFYETHLDAFKNSRNRVVTAVYYLNEEWNESDAGELVVYDIDNKHLATLLPKANTLIVFLSEKFPHEVLPTNKKRYSIATWFRVKQ